MVDHLGVLLELEQLRAVLGHLPPGVRRAVAALPREQALPVALGMAAPVVLAQARRLADQAEVLRDRALGQGPAALGLLAEVLAALALEMALAAAEAMTVSRATLSATLSTGSGPGARRP